MVESHDSRTRRQDTLDELGRVEEIIRGKPVIALKDKSSIQFTGMPYLDRIRISERGY